MILRISGLDQSLDWFRSYSALNDIMVKKALNFIKISHILTYVNGLKIPGKSESLYWLYWSLERCRWWSSVMVTNIAFYRLAFFERGSNPISPIWITNPFRVPLKLYKPNRAGNKFLRYLLRRWEMGKIRLKLPHFPITNILKTTKSALARWKNMPKVLNTQPGWYLRVSKGPV